MYGQHFQESMDQPGMITNPARGQLNRENEISLSPFAPENLVSQDGLGSPVPRQPAHLHTQTESGAYLLTGFLPSSAAAMWLAEDGVPRCAPLPSSSLVLFGRVAARERQGALSRRAW